MTAARDEVKKQTGADKIQPETITRFSRKQLIQTVLLVALVYVAYPFISTVPTFFNELGSANWWWALLWADGVGVDVCRCCSGLVGQRRRRGELPQSGHHAVRQHIRRDHHPAGVGGLALSTRFLQKAGLGTLRATAAVALQQSVQVITHVALLIFFSVAAGASADLSHFVPSATLLYLIGGIALGALGAFCSFPGCADGWHRRDPSSRRSAANSSS